LDNKVFDIIDAGCKYEEKKIRERVSLARKK